MILSIMYMSAIIVIGVSAIVGAALYMIDKNTERDDRPE